MVTEGIPFAVHAFVGSTVFILTRSKAVKRFSLRPKILLSSLAILGEGLRFCLAMWMGHRLVCIGVVFFQLLTQSRKWLTFASQNPANAETSKNFHSFVLFCIVLKTGFRNDGRGRFRQTRKASTFRANDVLS